MDARCFPLTASHRYSLCQSSPMATLLPSSLTPSHRKPGTVAPTSRRPTRLPVLESHTRTFSSIPAVASQRPLAENARAATSHPPPSRVRFLPVLRSYTATTRFLVNVKGWGVAPGFCTSTLARSDPSGDRWSNSSRPPVGRASAVLASIRPVVASHTYRLLGP